MSNHEAAFCCDAAMRLNPILCVCSVDLCSRYLRAPHLLPTLAVRARACVHVHACASPPPCLCTRSLARVARTVRCCDTLAARWRRAPPLPRFGSLRFPRSRTLFCRAPLRLCLCHCALLCLSKIALKDVKKDQAVMQIPRRVMLASDHPRLAQAPLAAAFASDPMLAANPSLALAVQLMHERNDPKSFWRPYLDVLPLHFDLPLCFSFEELKELDGSPAGTHARMHVHACVQGACIFRALRARPQHCLRLPVRAHVHMHVHALACGPVAFWSSCFHAVCYSQPHGSPHLTPSFVFPLLSLPALARPPRAARAVAPWLARSLARSLAAVDAFKLIRSTAVQYFHLTRVAPLAKHGFNIG